MTDLYVRRVPRHDMRLGRTIVHDPQSRGFPVPGEVDTSTWRTRSIRIWDPTPNPDQPVGNCTTCAKAMQLNAAGNRRTGQVLGMDWALDRYEEETLIDPFEGYFKRGDPNSTDTGSNGLASCKTVQATGEGGTYRWFLRGIDQVVTYLMLPDAVPTSTGSDWTYGMFSTNNREPRTGLPIIAPTGGVAGGHQYIYRGYIEPLDMLEGRCWWGDGFRDFLIAREHAGDLLAADGDSHVQVRA